VRIGLATFFLLAIAQIVRAELPATRPLEIEPRPPVKCIRASDGHYFIDFGKDAFGFLQLDLDSPDARELEIRLGEKAYEQSVDPKPGGSVRFATVKQAIAPGKHTYRVQTPPDKRNTSGAAIRLPESIGVVLPFRYVEVANCPVELDASMVRQMAVHYPFDDSASRFSSSDPALNEVWNFCKYSIKATTFAGVYVDGDRERIPYEADAYINQLCHYCVDHEYSLARYTHEYLLAHPTWPAEWKQHSVLMAYTDWMYSGDIDSLRRNYDLLKTEKVLSAYAREDGLIDSSKLKPVVDWPAGERDGYDMSPAINTVVNAFHFRTLVLMAEMAEALGKTDDAARFRSEAERVRLAFNAKLFDAKTGLYIDGEGATHSALHANLFPLAFGLVATERKPAVIAFLKSRRMACSPYAAQYLLEALFENGESDYAISLMQSDDIRSWRNMMKVGATITMEAWDAKFKPNLDWNHAWGAAPANIIPRYVLGVRPIAPGFAKVLVQPNPGNLKHIEGIVPTPRGPIVVKFVAEPRSLEVQAPESVTVLRK
jgi:hypothetical protein